MRLGAHSPVDLISQISPTNVSKSLRLLNAWHQVGSWQPAVGSKATFPLLLNPEELPRVLQNVIARVF